MLLTVKGLLSVLFADPVATVMLLTETRKYTYEPQSVKTSLNDEAIKNVVLLNYEVFKSYPENLMKLSPLFMKI